MHVFVRVTVCACAVGVLVAGSGCESAVVGGSESVVVVVAVGMASVGNACGWVCAMEGFHVCLFWIVRKLLCVNECR